MCFICFSFEKKKIFFNFLKISHFITWNFKRLMVMLKVNLLTTFVINISGCLSSIYVFFPNTHIEFKLYNNNNGVIDLSNRKKLGTVQIVIEDSDSSNKIKLISTS